MKNALDYLRTRFNLPITFMEAPIDLPDFNREEFAKMLAAIGAAVGVEIGVERGYFSEMLCRANPTLKLYCIDPWQTYASGHVEHATADTVEQFYRQAVQRLAPYRCTVLRQPSLTAVSQFTDNSLDFVFVDGDHSYEATMEDIVQWTRKLKPGGIMSGHDYYNRPPDQYLRSGPAARMYCNLTGTKPWFTFGRKLSHPDRHELQDSCRSFMWVKP